MHLRLCVHLRVLDIWLHWLSALLVQVSTRSGLRTGTPLPARGPRALLPSTEVLRFACGVGLRVPPPHAWLGWWCAFLLAGGAPLRRLQGWAEDPETLVLLAQARDLHRPSHRLGPPEHRHAAACACEKGRRRRSDQKSACVERDGAEWQRKVIARRALSKCEHVPPTGCRPGTREPPLPTDTELYILPRPAAASQPSPAQRSTLRSRSRDLQRKQQQIQQRRPPADSIIAQYTVSISVYMSYSVALMKISRTRVEHAERRT